MVKENAVSYEVHLFRVTDEPTIIRVNGRRRRKTRWRAAAHGDLSLKYCFDPSSSSHHHNHHLDQLLSPLYTL
ncbi:hypothetical protein M0802_011505 [Mischocyttarus mexicanus]|nr:hypothetical protein M0802_011505 [Mischocyttarus mexicanus]